MDLELATTDDIIQELRSRQMRFVLVSILNDNRNGLESTLVAAQADGVTHVYDLLEVAYREFTEMNDRQFKDLGNE